MTDGHGTGDAGKSPEAFKHKIKDYLTIKGVVADDRTVTSFHERYIAEKTPVDFEEYLETGGIDERFNDKNLLVHILQELDKDHQLDNAQKLTVFLVAVSAELPNPKDRVSVALKGDSSSGKDNLVRAVFKHFPNGESVKWTGATPSAFRDAVVKGKRFAVSELNADREGANYMLIEKFKQLAEDGIFDILKEGVGRKWVNIEIKVDQKTVFYSTTESAIDDELHTRFLIIPFYNTYQKNLLVYQNVLKSVADVKLTAQPQKSWIANSIRWLDSSADVVVPFADLFTKPVQGDRYLIDLRKDRSKRDIKRLLALVKAHAWLHQRQRHTEVVKGRRVIFAEPIDLLNVVDLCSDFFNLSYGNIDHRVKHCLEVIKRLESSKEHENEVFNRVGHLNFNGWVMRHTVQEQLGVTVNTVKNYIKGLQEYQLVVTDYDQNSKTVLISTKNAPVNSPVNDLSIPVSAEVLLQVLDRYLTPELIGNIYKKHEISDFNAENRVLPYISESFDSVNIDTSKSSPYVGQKEKFKGLFVGEYKGKPLAVEVIQKRLPEVTDEVLESWKQKGEIIENPAGWVMPL